MGNDSHIVKRKSILEDIDYHVSRNLFCERKNLTNEASVETFFVTRLLEDLGFKDHNIKTKESIEKLTVAKGSKKFNYKPDYAILFNKYIRLIIDAKATNENVFDWVEQCAHYCLLLNRKESKEPVEYFLITNGLKTVLFRWIEEEPLLELNFEDFYIGSEKYENLRELISVNAFSKPTETKKTRDVKLKKINKEEAQKLFLNCHKYIWSTEKRSPQSAFTEFVKLIFLKLWNDRIIHDQYSPDENGNLNIPSSVNTFSESWIESRELDLNNPINDIQFKDLLDHIQDDIYKRNKKRMFSDNEKISLKPTTIKGVVKKLEKVDLFGIDEDLNGRLFETFLNSTMRGQALGQYFTPRSIVLLGAFLADLKANKNHIDKVLDGSCGTGGFLIEALSIMRNQIRMNHSYTEQEKVDLINKISNECIYGVDAATEPNLARIARINMYLHGDGGSHIYFADGLQKTITIDKNDPKELQLEIEDFKTQMISDFFDVVLTNPPFSMWYEIENDAQKDILNEYELLNFNGSRGRLRGSAMFIERYRDLLKPGGKLISIIDETVLSSSQYSYFREFVRKYFIIRAVISLHGDAFQMAKARVKTALIYLEKKRNVEENQPAAFMYSSVCLGVDDLPVTSNPQKVKEARELAKSEIEEILYEFKRFKNGEEDKWLVLPDRLTDRLDVKYCVPQQGRFVSLWREKGFEVKKLKDICAPREEIILPEDYPDKEFRILTITYDGRCKTEETRLGKDINYKKMKIVRKGDIVFSEYNTFHGAIGYITEEFEGALASGSYIVARCENQHDSLYLWSILRTTEIRADFLTSAIGMGRQTINWDDIKNVLVPFLSYYERVKISQEILNAWEMEHKANRVFENISLSLDKKFNVESEESKKRFLAAKPPK